MATDLERELERKEALAKTTKEKTDEEEARRNCEVAMSQLRALQEGQRVTRYDRSTGEPYIVDDETKPAEVAAAQKTADTWCKR